MSEDAGNDADGGAEVPPEAVGQAAIEFMTGLATAFGTSATAELHVDGSEIDVQVNGSDLGLLIGPGGRTLMAVQDLARVASQRRLGDHDTRLRIDVAGYRERRRVALEKFATAVAHEVTESGTGKALEPMASADRKIIHDTIQSIDGVTSHSDGEEPRRRVVITPG
jgi:spoIIIJ-associated protein